MIFVLLNFRQTNKVTINVKFFPNWFYHGWANTLIAAAPLCLSRYVYGIAPKANFEYYDGTSSTKKVCGTDNNQVVIAVYK